MLTFLVALPSDQNSPARERAFADELTAQLRSAPGVQAAAYAKQLPMVVLKDAMPLARTPDPKRPMTPGRPDIRRVSRHYFDVMGLASSLDVDFAKKRCESSAGTSTKFSLGAA